MNYLKTGENLKKIPGVFAISIFAVILITTFTSLSVASPDPATATVYVYPATINATAAGQSFTVEIRVNNVIDLYAWQIGLTWDPDLLEIDVSGSYNGFGFGPFLGTFMTDYIGSPGEINNITGEIYPPSWATRNDTTGVDGSGTLAYIDLVAKKAGTSNVHLAEITLRNSDAEEIPTNVVGVFTVIVEENPPFHIVTVNNLTGSYPPYRLRVYDYSFNLSAKRISFNVTGPPGNVTICNITIPKTLMWVDVLDEWNVTINGAPLSIQERTVTYNGTHYSIYFTCNTSIITIQVISKYVVPEFPLIMIVTLLIISTLVVFSLGKTVKSAKSKGSSSASRGRLPNKTKH